MFFDRFRFESRVANASEILSFHHRARRVSARGTVRVTVSEGSTSALSASSVGAHEVVSTQRRLSCDCVVSGYM